MKKIEEYDLKEITKKIHEELKYRYDVSYIDLESPDWICSQSKTVMRIFDKETWRLCKFTSDFILNYDGDVDKMMPIILKMISKL